MAADKISRICWNTNGWVKPSGRRGKSTSQKAHEHVYGYGHEEWLCDFKKLIDDYHYAFLETINTKTHKHSGKIYNITLCTLDSKNKTWYWVGEIKNVEVIDEETADRVVEMYRERPWLDEMIKELDEVGVKEHNLQKATRSLDLFNIRFKPADFDWFDDNPVPFSVRERLPNERYKLLNKFFLPAFIAAPQKGLRFSEERPSPNGNVMVKKQIEEKLIEYPNIHSDLQRSLIKYLKKTFPNQKIWREAITGINTQIDIVREKEPEKYVFYEIKTYSLVRTSIRAALGQLFEYAFYNDEGLAQELVIVSDKKAKKGGIRYIRRLNKICNIPIIYMQFDHERGEVRQEIRGE
jgi:hypothetical protein